MQVVCVSTLIEDDLGLNLFQIRFPDWGTDAALNRWPEVQAKLTVGQAIRGDVVARVPYGVWLDIGVGWPALLQVPEMAGARTHPIKFEDYPPLGATIDAWVLYISVRGEIILCQYPPTFSENTPDN